MKTTETAQAEADGRGKRSGEETEPKFGVRKIMIRKIILSRRGRSIASTETFSDIDKQSFPFPIYLKHSCTISGNCKNFLT